MSISDTLDEDDELYDFVEDEENKGDEIYEDLMKTAEHPERVSEAHTALNQISPSVLAALLLINVQTNCCSSSRNMAWTNESAACRRSDRRKKNTRRHWSLWFRWANEGSTSSAYS